MDSATQAPLQPEPSLAPDRGRRMGATGRLLTWAAIAVLIVYLVFIGGGYPGIYSAQIRTLSTAIIATGLAVWLVVAWRSPFWRPRTLLWPAFAASLIVFAVGLSLSKTPRYGADYLAYALLLTGLYLVLQRLMADDFFRPRILALAAGLCFVIAVAFIAIVVNDWVGWWSLVGRIARPPLRPRFESLTFGNPAAVMTICVLLLVPAAVRIGWTTLGRRMVILVLAGLTLFVSLLSGSRSPWAALAVAIVVTGAAWALTGDNRRMVTRALASTRAKVALGAVLLAGLAVFAVFGPGLLFRTLSGGTSERLTFYIAAVGMFLASPIFGNGPGTWVPLRIQYTNPSGVDYYIPHAHDIYLQTLAEFGVLGALAGLVVVGYLAWLILDGLRDRNASRRAVAWGLLLTSIYFGANQLLDFYANMPAALFAYAIPVAWLDATATRSPMPAVTSRAGALVSRLGAAPSIAAVVALAVAVGWLGWSESSALPMDHGVTLANEENWSAALPYFRDAATADPGMPPYHFALGLAEANTGDLRDAEQQFAAEAAADDLPVAWLDLAAVRARLGDAAGERKALTEALRVGFQQPGVDLDAGYLYLGLGERDAAVHWFAEALERSPNIAADPWWQADPTRAALWPDIFKTALAALPPASAFDLSLSAGQYAQAANYAAHITDPAARSLADLVLPAWQAKPGGLAALDARARSDPLDMATVLWCARVAQQNGDLQRAAEYRRWADDLNGLSGVGGRPIRVVSRFTGLLGAGLSSSYYGQYTYRRPTPADQLVHSLPHLAYQ